MNVYQRIVLIIGAIVIFLQLGLSRNIQPLKNVLFKDNIDAVSINILYPVKFAGILCCIAFLLFAFKEIGKKRNNFNNVYYNRLLTTIDYPIIPH